MTKRVIQRVSGADSRVYAASRAARDAALAAQAVVEAARDTVVPLAEQVDTDAQAVAAAMAQFVPLAAQVDADAVAVEAARAQVVPLAAEVDADAQAVEAARVQVSANSTLAQTAAANAQSALALSGSYATLALANAALAGITEGHSVEVTSDASAAQNGVWAKRGGVLVQTSTDTVAAASLRARQALISSGELLMGPVNPSGNAAAGGVLISAFGRANMGFSIPAGQTGILTGINPYVSFTPDQVAALVGSTLRFTFVCTVTTGFLTDKPLVASPIGYISNTITGIADAGVLVSSTLVGNTLTRVIDYTMAANDAAFAARLAVASSASTAATHSLTLTSVSWEVTTPSASARTAGGAASLARMLTTRRPNIGAVYEAARGIVSVNNGAVVRQLNGRALGFTIPAGQTGGTSFIQPRLDVDQFTAGLFAGAQILMRYEFATSPAFARLLTVTGQVNTAGGATTRTPRVVQNVQFPGRRLIEFILTLTGSEIALQPFFSNTAGVSAQEDWIELTGMEVSIVGPAADATALEAINARAATHRLGGMPTAGSVQDICDFIVRDFAGAVPIVEAVTGKEVGFTIPVGQTGAGSQIQPVLPVSLADMAALAGRSVTWRFGLTTSAGFARTLNLVVQTRTQNGTLRTVPTSRLETRQVGARLLYTFTHALTGDEERLQPYLVEASGTTAVAEEFVRLNDISVAVAASLSDTLTLADDNARLARGLAAQQGGQQALQAVRGYYRVVVVAADGTGEFTSIAAALAAYQFVATSLRRYLLQIRPGIYNEINITPRDYIDIEGLDRRRCWVRGYLPPETNPSTISNGSTFNFHRFATIRGLRITAQNMRYAIHSDDPVEGEYRDILLEDCDVEHFGNEEAKAWQVANGGSAGLIWANPCAWGAGSASGMDVTLRRCSLRSLAQPYTVHSNVAFARPSRARLEHVQLHRVDADPTSPAIRVRPLASGQNDVLEVIGCSLRGAIEMQVSDWGSDPAFWAANRAEYVITGHGNSPAPYSYLDCLSRALRIQSADTSDSSSIVVSGSGADALFGAVNIDVSGGGLAGAAFGTWDVASSTTMGARLGDCSLTSKTLSVAVNGAAPVNIVFSTNLTAASNTSILATINAALAGAATASLMDVTERWRPMMTDEETPVFNGSAVALRRKRAVARASDGNGRVMNDTDPADLFVGIALEDIRPGAIGRVKTRGHLRVAVDIERSDAGAFSAGATLGVSGSDGRLALSAGIPLLRCVNSADVQLPE
jgi:hypothetical protein